MNESLQTELQTVKRKAADGLESVARKKKCTAKQMILGIIQTQVI